MIFGTLVGLKLPAFVLQVRKNPYKTSSRKLVPTEDPTRARWVTGAHAIACSTAVKCFIVKLIVEQIALLLLLLFLLLLLLYQ